MAREFIQEFDATRLVAPGCFQPEFVDHADRARSGDLLAIPFGNNRYRDLMGG